MNANLYELKYTFMITNFFRKINLPLFGRGLGGGLLLLFALPVFAQYNLSLCEGQGFMLTSDADGIGQLTYTWKEGVPPQAPGTVTAVPTLTVTGKPAGTYAYVCEVANAACALQSSSYTVEVLPAPAATNASANARCGAGTVTFSATVPEEVTIDWYDVETGGSTVTGGYGVTSFSPTINASTTYYAQARDINNSCVSATRLAVGATVNLNPTITTQPTASSTICAGGTVTLSVAASNATAYQWKRNNGANVTNGSGGTTAQYTTAALSANATFKVVVSNDAGCSVTSTNAVITVTTGAPLGSLPDACGCATGSVSNKTCCLPGSPVQLKSPSYSVYANYTFCGNYLQSETLSESTCRAYAVSQGWCAFEYHFLSSDGLYYCQCYW
jgi:hypothetical protein